jgi:hypothetical protein
LRAAPDLHEAAALTHSEGVRCFYMTDAGVQAHQPDRLWTGQMTISAHDWHTGTATALPPGRHFDRHMQLPESAICIDRA